MHEVFSFRIIREDLKKRYHQGRAMHIMVAIILFVYSLPFFLTQEWMLVIGFALPTIMILYTAIFKNQNLKDPNFNRIFRILEAGFLAIGSEHFFKEKNLLLAYSLPRLVLVSYSYFGLRTDYICLSLFILMICLFLFQQLSKTKYIIIKI